MAHTVMLIKLKCVVFVSELDLGNALLFSISFALVSRLQRDQNSAARLVTRTRRREHITPVLLDSSEVQIMVQDSAPHIQNVDRHQYT